MTTARYTGSVNRFATTALRQAMADAATELAEMAQQRTRDAAPRRFKVRNPSIAKMVKRRRANTRTVTAQVYVEGPAGRRGIGRILTRHEQGGVMRPESPASSFRQRIMSAGRRLLGLEPKPRFAVPTSAVREGARGRVTRAQKPRNLDPRKVFVGRDKDGDTVLFRRKYEGTKRETVEGLFVLKPTIRLRPRLQLVRDAQVVMRRHATTVFRRQMALATARVGVRRGLSPSSPLGPAA